MDIFAQVDAEMMKKALKLSKLPTDTDPTKLVGEDYHSLMTNLAKSVSASFANKEEQVETITFESWIEDSIQTIIKNHIAMEVYEKTLSHKVMPNVDWKIDIRSQGYSHDQDKWIYDWKVEVEETHKALISGSMGISFGEVIALCMKTALSR